MPGMLDIQSLFPQEAQLSARAQMRQAQNNAVAQSAALGGGFNPAGLLQGQAAQFAQRLPGAAAQMARGLGRNGRNFLTPEQNLNKSLADYTQTQDEGQLESTLRQYNPQAMPGLQQARQQRNLQDEARQRQARLDELNRRNIESQIAFNEARSAQVGAPQSTSIQRSVPVYGGGFEFIGIGPNGPIHQVSDAQGNLITDPEERQEFLDNARKMRLADKAEELAQGTLTEAGAKRITERVDQGLQAAQSIPTLERTMELLQQVETGGWDSVVYQASRLFGIQDANAADLDNQLGQAVLQQIKPIFGAQPSAAEGQWLRDISAGFSTSTEANLALINRGLELARKRVESGKNAARAMGDAGLVEIQEMDSWMEFRYTPYRVPKEVNDPEPGTLRFVNGQWVE